MSDQSEEPVVFDHGAAQNAMRKARDLADDLERVARQMQSAGIPGGWEGMGSRGFAQRSRGASGRLVAAARAVRATANQIARLDAAAHR